MHNRAPAIFTAINGESDERPLPSEAPPDYVLNDPVLLNAWNRRYPGWAPDPGSLKRPPAVMKTAFSISNPGGKWSGVTPGSWST